MKTALNTGSFRKGDLLEYLTVLDFVGIKDIELNLRPIIDDGYCTEKIREFIKSREFNICSIAGGWCDFFLDENYFTEIERSIDKQIELCKVFNCNRIRLFFGLLPVKYINKLHFEHLIRNVKRISAKYPSMEFLFETHDHNSVNPEFLQLFFEQVNADNVKLNFDPINLERFNVNWMDGFNALYSFIGHVHIKGLKNGSLFSYRDSQTALTLLFRKLKDINYGGYLSLEYEADGDILLNIILDYKQLIEDLNKI